MRIRIPTLLLAALLVVGCSDDGPTTITGDPPDYETDLSVPENVITNLALAHGARDYDTYAGLLGARFTFQPASRSGWNGEIPDRDRDLALTREMFLGSTVSEIRLALSQGTPQETLYGGTEDAIRIRTTSLLLDVDVPGDVTLRVKDHVQEFFLQLGRTEDGEDPGRYYLRAWEDTGSVPGSLRGADAPVPVTEYTWSEVKKEFDR